VFPAPVSFDSVGRLPAADDNVAIAIRRIEAGTTVLLRDGAAQITHTVLEGHRFAVVPIAIGSPLFSWGLPFGTACRSIAPGGYVCNTSMLEALGVRDLGGATLPPEPNFVDRSDPFVFNESRFSPAPPVARIQTPGTFAGFRRSGRRGVGTRNYIVILGTTSRTASVARQLAARLQPLARVFPGIDGIVPVAHTEGGGTSEPNNTAEILRALAGFTVHPNVAAVLALDFGTEPVTNVRLETFMRERRYPLDDVLHHFLTFRGSLASGLAEGEAIVRAWLPVVSALPRTPEPLAGLRIALQCGGSDAFSGVSGNPLAGAVVHELIRHGGTGVLTETDEAIGAESYLLQNIRDADTARALLGKIDSFRARLRWHGVTPESNPSGGNKFRGLYNIALKSLGAVHKKDPRTRIDFVTDYAEPLGGPGFHFMNGPGNDLEGVAGQIAAGCNLVLFVTGNGSITNFPFVPTLKITTTSRRHQLLIHEMDINAGRYLDGESMTALAVEAFETVIATASGRRTRGEHAGHSQVSLWRNWRQTDDSRVTELTSRIAPDGVPLRAAMDNGASRTARTNNGGRYATERVGLVLPTSLCAAQIARLAAERLNAKHAVQAQGIFRYVALAHTEGCGFGGESMYRLLHRTYRGYITHPNVAAALLLEHGCEKVPNDIMRRQLESAGLPATRFGWASVQLDGGIEKSIANVEAWFAKTLEALPAPRIRSVDIGDLTIGLMSAVPVQSETAQALARLVNTIVNSGGSVLVPESDSLWRDDRFVPAVLGEKKPHATLSYGQPTEKPGLHVVATETEHWVENLTGLSGCGAHVVLTMIGDHPQQGHPLVPVIQAAEAQRRGALPAEDIDLFLQGDATSDERLLLDEIRAVAEQKRVPRSLAGGFVDFQLTRGLLGVTT
jgi:altronate dehydratase